MCRKAAQWPYFTFLTRGDMSILAIRHFFFTITHTVKVKYFYRSMRVGHRVGLQKLIMFTFGIESIAIMVMKKKAKQYFSWYIPWIFPGIDRNMFFFVNVLVSSCSPSKNNEFCYRKLVDRSFISEDKRQNSTFPDIFPECSLEWIEICFSCKCVSLMWIHPGN
jgi:hypothetical protein